MKHIILTFFSFWICIFNSSGNELGNFYPANHDFIQYTGRIDFSNPTKPKVWASGAYIEIKFNGTFCTLQINDELLWGKIHNYIEIKVDNLPAYRIQLTGKENTIELARNLAKGEHTILICKNTEFENGYVEIVGFTADKLLKPNPKKKRKIVMPQVFDKVNMARDTIKWDFKLYQPDVVTVCLGQNDGVQDSAQFTTAYLTFAKTLRRYYPKAKLIFLSSPMANLELKAALVKCITAVEKQIKASGDSNIGSYFFTKQYNKGCGSHPSVEEHAEIGSELTTYLKKTMKW